jgi:hypothetical protein
MQRTVPSDSKVFKQRALATASHFEVLESVAASQPFAMATQVPIDERRLPMKMIVQPLRQSVGSTNRSTNVNNLLRAVANDVNAMC